MTSSYSNDLWIESLDDTGVFPTIFIEVTDLGSAQLGTTGQIGDLILEAQFWGFSASISRQILFPEQGEERGEHPL